MDSNTAVLSSKDFRRLKTLVSDQDHEHDAKTRKRQDLHALSQSRYHHWGDTVENMRKKKEEIRLQRLAEKEAAQLKIDQEEFQYQESLRQQTIQRAQKLLHEQEDQVKAFQSKLLLADVLQERQSQIVLNQSKKEKEKVREQYYLQLAQENLEKMKQREEREAIERKKKSLETSQDQLAQLREYQERFLRVKQVELHEGERISKEAQEAVIKEREDVQKRRDMARQANAQNVESNRLLQQLKEAERQREAEEEARIMHYANEKERMLQMRKDKEHERFKSKMDTRQRLIDEQIRALRDLQAEENNRLETQVKEAEARNEEKLRDETEKRNKLLADVHASRQDMLRRKLEAKQRKLQADINFSEEWRQTQQVLEQEDNEVRKHVRTRAETVQNELVTQMTSRQAIKAQEKEQHHKEAAEIQKMIKASEKEFENFALSLVKQYEAAGKDVKPLLLQLQKERARKNKNL